MSKQGNRYSRNMKSWGGKRNNNSAGDNQHSNTQQSEGAMDSYVERSDHGSSTSRPRRPEANVMRGPPRHGKEMPSPSHLSKTESQLKNDPLYEEAFFPSPLEEMRPISKEVRFYPGSDGFPQLSSEIYSMIAQDYNYKRNVPECAHEYYLGILLHARLLELHESNQGRLTFDQSVFLNAVKTGKYMMPLSFHRYLASFGNFDLPSGKDQLFALRDTRQVDDPDTELSGYFGSIMDHAGLYTSYVCPAILARKIQECLRFTRQGVNPDWNLPVIFSYIDADGDSLPLNSKCLGYSPAVNLSRDHVQLLSHANITENVFECYAEVPFHPGLMNAVASYMQSVRNIELVGMPTSINGSQGQIVSVTSLPGRIEKLYPQSAYQVVGSLAYLGAGYQYLKIKSDDSIHWPNTFPRGLLPDQNYRESIQWNQRNIDPKILLFDYSGVEFDPHIRSREIVSRDFVIRK